MSTLAAVGGRRTQPKLPFEPLFKVLGTRNISEVARALGKDRAQITRLINDGITASMADELAVAAGRHPYELWPEAADMPLPEPTPQRRNLAAVPAGPAGIVWEEPPPSRRGKGAVLVEPTVLSALRSNAGRWARIRDFAGKTTAGSYVGKYRKELGEGWEVRASRRDGGSAIYLRFVAAAE